MYLLATVTARDLGWIGTHRDGGRLEATLATIGRLERFRGHLYNWYDTRDLGRSSRLRVDGRQRQPLRAPPGAVERLPRDARPAAARRGGARRHRRRDRADARRRPPAIGDGRRSADRHAGGDLDDALRAVRDVAAGCPDDRRRRGRRADRLSTQTPARSPTSLRALTADRAERIARGELVAWAEAAAACRVQPRPGPRDRRRGRGASHRRRERRTCASTGACRRSSGWRPTRAGAGCRRSRGTPQRRWCARLQAIADGGPAALFGETDFRFLFDPTRKLFSIGFRVRDGDPRPELLRPPGVRGAPRPASSRSPRATSTASHWFRLGRPLTPVGRGSALVSWSGSMFEYLMPALVMRAPWLSLLDHTYRLVVGRQIGYADEQRRALGHLRVGLQCARPRRTYQYSSFGVPGLGPETRPRGGPGHRAVCHRPGRDDRARGGGQEPRPPGRRRSGRPIRVPRGARLHAATTARGRVGGGREELHGAPPGHGARGHRERPQRRGDGRTLPRRADRPGHRAAPAGADAARRRWSRARAPKRSRAPPTCATSCRPSCAASPRRTTRRRARTCSRTAATRSWSRPRARATAAGATSPCHALAGGRDPRCMGQLPLPARHRGPATCGPPAISRAGSRPTATRSTTPRTARSSRVATVRSPPSSTIVVSAEDDAEIRRVSLTNLGSRSREIELTSYAEIALAPQAADVAHPAFQNLFVQTEFVPERRRARSRRAVRGPADERPIWAAHVAAVEDEAGGGDPVRDRPRPLPRPRPFGPRSPVVGGRRAPPLEHGRRGPRPDLQPPPPGAARARRRRPT